MFSSVPYSVNTCIRVPLYYVEQIYLFKSFVLVSCWGRPAMAPVMSSVPQML